jgi:hypothetical protein
VREMMSPWWPFGRGWRAVFKRPYLELEVRPVSDGWRWSVQKIVPASGSFSIVHEGLEESSERAKQAATEAAGT